MMENPTLMAWKMGSVKAPLEKTQEKIRPLQGDEALIQVAGCGVCHTDISFWHDGVPVRHSLPLTLGHEISGVVLDGPPRWKGKSVVVPAVLPCGECDFCKTGRSNICRNQKMPGNDFHGGFATHVIVPSRYLCEVPEALLSKFSLPELAVVADAVSTPYQVMLKSELQAGDLAIILGAGGVGLYGIQIAKAMGAMVLVADIREDKLEAAQKAGADQTVNIGGLDSKASKQAISAAAKAMGAPPFAWKIFEMSGTQKGQELGFALVTFASTLSIVGFTLDKPEVRLSNLMAFDAKLIGTWGCRAELYPEILQWIADGKIDIKPFVEFAPLDQINEVFQAMVSHQLKKRTVLVP